MSLILSKTLKSVVSIALCLCMMLVFSGCSKMPKDIDKADQICVSGALYESWMYVLTDEAFIDEIVTIFEDLKIEKSDSTLDGLDMMTAGETLTFTFSKGEETYGTVIVDSNNHLCFEVGAQAYIIKSDFDFYYVKELVDKEIEKVNISFSTTTPDEI